MMAALQIAVPLRGCPCTCLWVSVSLLCAFHSLQGGNTSDLAVARVAGGDGTGLGAIRGGDQVMLCLPDLFSGPGDEGAGMCGAAELSRNAVPRCPCPQVATSGPCAWAQIASVLGNECWGSPAPPGPPVHPSSGSEWDASKRGVTIASSVLNLPSQHFQNFLLTLMMQALWFFGWLGFSGTSETQDGMNPALDFRAEVFLGQAVKKPCLYL